MQVMQPEIQMFEQKNKRQPKQSSSFADYKLFQPFALGIRASESCTLPLSPPFKLSGPAGFLLQRDRTEWTTAVRRETRTGPHESRPAISSAAPLLATDPEEQGKPGRPGRPGKPSRPGQYRPGVRPRPVESAHRSCPHLHRRHLAALEGHPSGLA